MTLIDNDPKQAAAIYVKAEKTKAEPALISAALADKDNLRFTLAPEHTERIADFGSNSDGAAQGCPPA